MIRQPLYQLLTAKYEVFEAEDSEAPVGKASVTDGFIESLMIQKGSPENYQGQILNRLLRAILEDADRNNSNLSIKVAEPDAFRLKRFFERYGFRETHPSIYKRNAGAALPPSVLY